MANARFEYKCRRCGKVEQRCATSAENGQVCLIAAIRDDASYLQPSLGPNRPTLITTHYCGPDGMGVADLIGYSVAEE